MLENYLFKLASPSQLGSVLAFRREVYTAALGHDGVDRFDEAAHHLIAVEPQGEVVATLRIVGPECRPFDLENLLDLSAALDRHPRPGEISRFCIRPGLRHVGKGGGLHLAMFKLAYALACRQEMTDLVTLALPHLQILYRKVLFEPLGPSLRHPTWGPVQPMRFDIVRFGLREEETLPPVARFLLAPSPTNFHL